MSLRKLIGFGVPAVAATSCAMEAGSLRLSDAWLIPSSLLAFNFIEYSLHRWPMHRPGSPLYDHVLIHHHAISSHEEIKKTIPDLQFHLDDSTVILPWYVLLAASWLILVLGAEIKTLLGFHSAMVFMSCGFGYYLAYELLHYSYHHGVLPRLAKHHLIHHSRPLWNPRNFNITIPIWDWLLGTGASDARP